MFLQVWNLFRLHRSKGVQTFEYFTLIFRPSCDGTASTFQQISERSILVTRAVQNPVMGV